MNLLAVNFARRSYSTRPETQLVRSGGIGRQIDNPEDSARSRITDQINPRAIPVIVEVPTLERI